MKIHWVWDELVSSDEYCMKCSVGWQNTPSISGERGRVGGKGKGNEVDRRSVTEESAEFLSLCLCVRIPHEGLINKWCLKWEQLSTDHLNFMKSACLQSCVCTFTCVHVCRSWVIPLLSFPGTGLCWVCVLTGFLLITAGILSMLMMKEEALPWGTEQTHMHINIYLARDAREH